MTRAQLFAALLIVLDIAAACVYGFDGDARRCIDWLAALVLTVVETFYLRLRSRWRFRCSSWSC